MATMTRANARRAPLTGERLGRYTLGPRIGTGGAASVYLALLSGPHDFERILAVKVVHEHLAESEDFVNMFIDEANLAVRLVHPNIVHSYELGREGSHLFLAMEHLAGQPLSKLVDRARERGEKLSPELVAWIGARAADALSHAHSLTDDAGRPVRFVHRDVSPQNVFLTYDGRVILIDFGIARAEGRLTHTGLGRIKGKFSYMPVEQLTRDHVDHRADLFSLGASLYQAAVGRLPFAAADEAESIASLLEDDAPSPETWEPAFPRAFSNVLLHALQRAPDDRYADAEQMARDLDAVAASCTNPSAMLGELLRRLFAEERDSELRAIAEMRSRRKRIAHLPLAATTTADPTAVTIPPVPRPRSRIAVFASLGALGVALSGGAAWWRHSLETNTPTSVPDAATYTLEVQVEPAVAATITVDGHVEGGPRARFTLSGRTAPVEIGVTAEGFESARTRAVPDRDRFVAVRLLPQAPPSAPPVTPGPIPGSAPSVPVTSASRTAQARPAATSVPPPATPRPAPKKRDSLVTDYPF